MNYFRVALRKIRLTGHESAIKPSRRGIDCLIAVRSRDEDPSRLFFSSPRDLEFTRRRVRSILSVAQRSNESGSTLTDGTNYYRYYTRRGSFGLFLRSLRFFFPATTMTTTTGNDARRQLPLQEPQKNRSSARKETRFHRLYASVTPVFFPTIVRKVSDALPCFVVFLTGALKLYI